MGKIADNLTTLGRFLLLIAAAVLAIALSSDDPGQYQASAQKLARSYDQLLNYRNQFADDVGPFYRAQLMPALQAIKAAAVRKRIGQMRIYPRYVFTRLEGQSGNRESAASGKPGSQGASGPASALVAIPLDPAEIRIADLDRIGLGLRNTVSRPVYNLAPDGLASLLARYRDQVLTDPDLGKDQVYLLISGPTSQNKDCDVRFEAPPEPGKHLVIWGDSVACTLAGPPSRIEAEKLAKADTEQFRAYFHGVADSYPLFISIPRGYGTMPYLEERTTLEPDARELVKKQGEPNTVLGIPLNNALMKSLAPLAMLFVLLLMCSDTIALRTLPVAMREPKEAVQWLAQFRMPQMMLPSIMYVLLPFVAASASLGLTDDPLVFDRDMQQLVPDPVHSWWSPSMLFGQKGGALLLVLMILGAGAIMVGVNRKTRVELLGR